MLNVKKLNQINVKLKVEKKVHNDLSRIFSIYWLIVHENVF